jgi:fibronectin-binding autotransporter adhesin
MPSRLIPSRFILGSTNARLTLGVLISVLFLVLAATPGALAADHTWSGGGADDNWGTDGNWNGGVPNGDDRVIFDSDSTASLNNSNNLGAGSLTGMQIRLVDPTGNVTITGDNITLASVDPTIDLSVAQKDLTININMTQIGDTYYDVAAGRTLTIGGDVDGPGIFTKQGDGTLFSNGNNLLCATYDITGGTLKLGAANVLPAASAVAVGAGAVLDLNDNNQTIGSLSGLGQVDLRSGNFIFGDANDTTFGGLIGGNANTGNVTKQGAGKVTLTGGERGRFTTGTLSINAGTLQVDNFWVSISVAVAAGATLQGNGIIITPVGVVTINAGGNLAPGGSTGQLFCENGVTLAAGANFNVELNGTTVGTGYDQLIVDESLDLGGSNLNLNLGLTPASGDTFTIIDYLSLGAVTGTFNGLGEGATFVSGGTQFQITYAGGQRRGVDLPGSSNIGHPDPIFLQGHRHKSRDVEWKPMDYDLFRDGTA